VRRVSVCWPVVRPRSLASTGGESPHTPRRPLLAAALPLPPCRPATPRAAMFTLSPLPQLVHNFCNLSDLAGLSLGTMLLAMLGNAACIPRALFTRDRRVVEASSCGAGRGAAAPGHLIAASSAALTNVPQTQRTPPPPPSTLPCRAWTWGSTWGCVVMGWAQCLSLCLGVNPATG
jgi:hypothetical protein